MLIAAATSTAPWWGISAFTLGGALLGALVTQGFTLFISHRETQAERNAATQLLSPGLLTW